MPTVLYPTAFVAFELMPDLGEIGSETTSARISCVPRALKVERNDHQTADTAEITLDFESFPFDPRIIRGGTVEAFIADAGSAEGTFWEALKSDPATARSRCIFMGVIDEISNSLEDDRTVTIKCRDYTAYLLDTALEPGAIPYGTKTLAEIVRGILDQLPTTTNIAIEARGDRVALLKPSSYMIRGDNPDTGARKIKEGETPWELIQELAVTGGIVAYVELDAVVLAEPATLQLDESPSERERHWALGRDVMSFQSSRQLGRRSGIVVQVSSWDPEDGITRRARAPRKEVTIEAVVQVPATKLGDDGKKKPTERPPHIRPYVVRGVRDQGQLQQIADAIYEQLRHHSLEATITTHNFTDVAGKPITGLRYGDPVVLDVAPEFPSHLAEPPSVQVERLIALGYRVQDAQALTDAFAALRVPFWINRVTYDYDGEGDPAFTLTVEIRSRKPVEVST